MNDNVNNAEKIQHTDKMPSNKAELRSLSKKSDRVFVYAPSDADEVKGDGVV